MGVTANAAKVRTRAGRSGFRDFRNMEWTLFEFIETFFERRIAVAWVTLDDDA
jgi:hypothetical protein